MYAMHANNKNPNWWVGEEAGCMQCGKSGNCAQCNGTGEALTGRCITCRGTGRCHWCDGTGILSYSILDSLPDWAERLFKSFRK